jgi:hypothetical protein
MASDSSPSEEIRYTMLVAVVQAQDFDSANNALTHLGMSVTRLPSIGGFLGRRNVTLMIGTPQGKNPQPWRRFIRIAASELNSSPFPWRAHLYPCQLQLLSPLAAQLFFQ